MRSVPTLAVVLGLVAGCADQAPKPEATKQPLPFLSDAYPSTYAPLPRNDTFIVGATLLDGAGRRIENAALYLRDGRIAAVGIDLQPPPGAELIDARGRWVTPGIVDVHSHAGDFAYPYTSQFEQSSDVNEATDPNTANVWAEHSLTLQDPTFARLLASGVTTLHVMPGSTNLFGGRTVVLKTVPGNTMRSIKFPDAPQGLKMACGENPLYNYGDKGRFPSSRMGNVAGYREAWSKARAYLEKWEKYQRGDSDDAPDRDLKLDTLAAVLRGDLRVHVHCYRADDMALLLDVAREFGVRITAFHHAAEAYKIADLLAREGVCAVVWSDWWGFKMEVLDGIRQNAAYVHAAGGCVAMHSDSAIVGQRLAIEAAKAAAAGRRMGVAIEPERAIAWVTSAPARMLGLEDRIGSLEVGKNADVVIWSGDPFSIYTKADQVFVDGARVYDRGDPQRQPRSDFELAQPAARSPP